MANVTKPIALDESLNTTENTPRNIADVLASGLSSIANNVKPDASDIDLAPITGMSATNVQNGVSELKQSLVNYIKVKPVEIAVGDLTKGMNLSTNVTSELDSGYKFLYWQTAGISSGWTMSFPIYLGEPNKAKGAPYWNGTLSSTGSVIFYFFEILDI